jgi:hypothetical protein
MWVENAKRDHLDFVQKMRDRGVRPTLSESAQVAIALEREGRSKTTRCAACCRPH